jgi:hypothetical protein
MTNYENFLLSVYHAKLKWMAVKSNDVPIPWDATIQRDIDALASFSAFEIEAHVIAVKSYYKEEIDYPAIIEVVRLCCIQQGEQRNVNAFTMCVYNRVELSVKSKNNHE